MTVSELAAFVGGQLVSGGDGAAIVTGAAGLADAGPGDVTFFASPRYLASLRSTQATAVFVPVGFSETVPSICIQCESPAVAFAAFLKKIAPAPVTFSPGVHPTAVIGQGVVIGNGASIQPYAVLEDGVAVGERTVIGAYAYLGHGAKVGNDSFLHARVTIGERCVVGSRVVLHGGVVLGADGFGFEFQSGRHVKVPQTGIVQVDDDVEIGANSCVDRARFGRTWIQEGTKIDNLVQIGHNVIVGKHCVLCGQVGISGSTRIGNYVTLAGQVGVAGHLEIGDQVTVGAQSGIPKSLPSNAMYMGYPALPMQEYLEQNARVRNLERLRRRVAALEQELREKMKSLPPEV